MRSRGSAPVLSWMTCARGLRRAMASILALVALNWWALASGVWPSAGHVLVRARPCSLRDRSPTGQRGLCRVRIRAARARVVAPCAGARPIRQGMRAAPPASADDATRAAPRREALPARITDAGPAWPPARGSVPGPCGSGTSACGGADRPSSSGHGASDSHACWRSGAQSGPGCAW